MTVSYLTIKGLRVGFAFCLSAQNKPDAAGVTNVKVRRFVKQKYQISTMAES